jgi:iron complex outermembrane recepter protein
MKRTIIRLVFLVLISLWTTLTMAQERKTITGIVRDNNGNPLSGITFNVKGTKTAGVTDANGYFKVTVSGNEPVLVFSSIGYLAKEVPVGASTTVSVALEPNAKQLNEVVVTGFGVKRQTRKVAFAVQQVRGEDLSRANSPSIINAMQGKIAGVSINQGAGGPSSSSRIRIRGNASLDGNTQPLFVVDGVLIKPGTSGADSWGDNRDFGNELKNLNSDDYETVTVLKGAAATALYGSDALFGVVLITTKKGKERKGLGVNLSQSVMFEKAYKLPDFQNEFGGGYDPFFVKGADGVDEVESSLGPYYSFGPKYDGHMVRDVDGRMVPWQANNLLDLYRTGQYYNTNVAVEGGSDKTTIRFSYTNTKSNSVMPNNSFKRDVFTLRATQKVNSFFNMDATVTYATSNSLNPIIQGGNSNPLFRLAYSNSRNYDVNYYTNHYIDPNNGGMIGAAGNPSPSPYQRASMMGVFWNYYQNNYSQKEDNLRANLDMNFNVLPWLNFLLRGNVSATNVTKESKERGQLPGFYGGYYSLYQSNNKYGRLQALANATRTFGQDFDLNVSIGGETNRGLGGSQMNANTQGGFKIPDLYDLTNSKDPMAIQTNALGKFPVARQDALYAYGDLTWRQMLTLNFSARNDWNSTLTYPDGHGDYSYFYPSVGLAWIFTETLKDNSALDFISFGKLRASLGYSGAGTAIYATSAGYYGLLGNYTDYDQTLVPRYGYTSNTLSNQNLKPQRGKEFELGADIRFFKNRLGIDFAWYKKNTINQILELPAPAESGITSRIINAGNIQNKGIEIVLTGAPIRNRNFEWNTTFNFSRNRNKIIELADGITSKDLDLAFGADVKSVATVGKDYGTIVTTYAYAYYQAKDGSGNPVANAANGKKLLKQDGTFWRSGDAGQGAKELGTMMEDFLLSNINEVSYKNFFLTLQFDSKFGGLMASATHQYGSEYGSFKSTLFGRDAAHGGVAYVDAQGRNREDGIIPDGVFDDGVSFSGVNVGGMSYADAVAKGYVKPMAAADYYEGIASWGTGIREYSVFENSWVAVREFSLGYTVPTKLASKIKMQSLRLSLVGRNLLYLYNSAKDNINPEGVFSSRSGTFAEYGGLPFIRSYGFTLNAGF